jgi:hypothetical protein
MAGYRQIHTQIWKDEWFIELTPEEKMLFIYLFSNDLSSISGIYKIPIRVIVNETGISGECVLSALAKFEGQHKVIYRDGVMWIVNMEKYHKNASPKTQAKVWADVDKIHDCELKQQYIYYSKHKIYSMDTVSIPVSESLSESESLNKSKSSVPPLFSDNEAEQLYRAVTHHNSTPSGERQSIYDALRCIISQQGENAVDYLHPFWTACHERYPGTVKAFWLTDWAATGIIPNGKKPDEKPDLKGYTYA